MRRLPVVVLALIVGLGSSVAGKGPTVKLTIAGGRLTEPIDVTNPTALVNVWTGCRDARSWWDFPRPFIGALSAEPDAALPRYTVSFYVKAFTEQPQVRVLYVVRYVPDPKTGMGYIFLPREDAQVVSQPGNGKWNRASAEWSSAINAILAAAK